MDLFIKLKDLLASCSANVGQYHGIKRGGGSGGLSPCHHSCSYKIYSKSLAPPQSPSHHPSFPRGRHEQLSSQDAVHCTAKCHRANSMGTWLAELLAPCPIQPDTHSAASAGRPALETSWMPKTCLALCLVLCDGVNG